MKSVVTEDFRARFAQLPEAIQQQARAAYRIFKANPQHPGLRYHNMTVKRGGKTLHPVSIGIHYRALAQRRTPSSNSSGSAIVPCTTSCSKAADRLDACPAFSR